MLGFLNQKTLPFTNLRLAYKGESVLTLDITTKKIAVRLAKLT